MRRDPPSPQSVTIDSASVAGAFWSGRRLAIARAAWLASVLLAVVLFSASLPAHYDDLLNLRFGDYSKSDLLRSVDAEAVRVALAELGLPATFYATFMIAFEVAIAASGLFLGLVIARRGSETWASLVFSSVMIVSGTAVLPTIYSLERVQPTLEFPIRLLHYAGIAFTILGFYMFPNGQLVPSWTRPLAAVWVAWLGLLVIFPASPLDPARWPALEAFLFLAAWHSSGIVALVYRYRRSTSPTQRLQMKWAVYGLVAMGAGVFVITLPAVALPLTGRPAAIYELAKLPAIHLVFFGGLLAIAVSILRHRLWDIDLIINRTLVYIPLTAILGGLYTASIALSQRLFVVLTGDRSDAAIVLTTLIVASAFTPVKNGLQTAVDKRYRESADRTKQLRALHANARAVLDVFDARRFAGQVLDEALAAFHAGCGAVYGERHGCRQLLHATAGWQEEMARIVVPLRSEGEQLGFLALGARHGEREYTHSDIQLLAELADEVARAIRLAGWLEASRDARAAEAGTRQEAA